MITRVVVITIAVELAPDVAHFVQEAITEMLFRALRKVGTLNGVARTPPACLTESTAGVGEDKADFGHIVLKDDAIELLVPSLKLSDSDLHSDWVFGYTTLYANSVP